MVKRSGQSRRVSCHKRVFRGYRGGGRAPGWRRHLGLWGVLAVFLLLRVWVKDRRMERREREGEKGKERKGRREREGERGRERTH